MLKVKIKRIYKTNYGFYITQGMALLLLRPLDLPANFVLNLIIYITNPKNNIGYWSKTNDKI